MTGTSGTFIDDIGVKDFSKTNEIPFHVVRKAKNGKAVFLAGPRGRIGRLID